MTRNELFNIQLVTPESLSSLKLEIKSILKFLIENINFNELRQSILETECETTEVHFFTLMVYV